MPSALPLPTAGPEPAVGAGEVGRVDAWRRGSHHEQGALSHRLPGFSSAKGRPWARTAADGQQSRACAGGGNGKQGAGPTLGRQRVQSRVRAAWQAWGRHARACRAVPRPGRIPPASQLCKGHGSPRHVRIATHPPV